MAGKGFDAKAFLVNHTEKLVLGAAGLMVLAFLGGSQWSSYKGTPAEITNKVSKSQKDLVGHGWPEEDRLKYELAPAKMPKQQVYENLLSPIAVAQYEMSTRFISSPWQGKEPLREPSLLTLEDAIASSGKVLIELPVDPTKVEEVPVEEPRNGRGRPVPKTEEPPETPVPEDDEFATARPSGLGVGGLGADGEGFSGGLASGLPGAATPGGTASSPYAAAGRAGNTSGGPGTVGLGGYGGVASNGGTSSSGGGASSYEGMSGGYGGMGGFGGAGGPVREAEGHYLVSVRAVFPLKEQIRRYQEAIHAKTVDIASLSFEVIDFNLEKQEQIGTEDQWTPWEPVDIKAATDVLDRAMGADPDVVSGTVTNHVMTMPLPPRIFGLWKKLASHPRIEKFELNDEQTQQEIEFQTKMLELMREKKSEVKPKVQKGGFSSRAMDSRALQSDVFGGSAYGGGMGGPMGGMAMGMAGMGSGNPMNSRSMGSNRSSAPAAGKTGTAAKSSELMKKLLETDDKDERGAALKEYIKQRVTADGELLLFRYLDFAVDPGKTYRYRVRLILNNPNFGHLASEANGEALVVEGETRTTEWSNVTAPVTIEREIYYFVKDVNTKSGRTSLSLFQWVPKIGTTVNADIELYPGQHIAGSVKKANVIDPAKMKNEEKEYSFTSSDVFVETHSDVALDRSLHKDLNLTSSTGDVLLPEEVLVVQGMTGELAVIDPVRQGTELARLSDQQKAQDKSFESLKASAAGAGAGMLGYPGAMGDGEGTSSAYGSQSSQRGGGKGGRSRNPLAGGSGSMGMSGMGMPGMGAPGMGGPGMSGPGRSGSGNSRKR